MTRIDNLGTTNPQQVSDINNLLTEAQTRNAYLTGSQANDLAAIVTATQQTRDRVQLNGTNAAGSIVAARTSQSPTFAVGDNYYTLYTVPANRFVVLQSASLRVEGPAMSGEAFQRYKLSINSGVGLHHLINRVGYRFDVGANFYYLADDHWSGSIRLDAGDVVRIQVTSQQAGIGNIEASIYGRLFSVGEI